MNKLKQIRIEHKITQEKLAKDIQVSRVSISQWENGKNQPDIETMHKLSNYFNITLDELFGSEYRALEYLKEDEKIFIKLYNSLSSKNKEFIIKLIKFLINEK